MRGANVRQPLTPSMFTLAAGILTARALGPIGLVVAIPLYFVLRRRMDSLGAALIAMLTGFVVSVAAMVVAKLAA